MSEMLKPYAEFGSLILEAFGIAVIVSTALYAILFSLWKTMGRAPAHDAYERARQILGRGILFGLEFLVAADIIHTVAVELTFTTVGVLSIIVVIRTFLSFTLEVELTGRWPWRERT